MRKMRKTLSLLLSLLMVISIMPIGTAGLYALKAEAAETTITPTDGGTKNTAPAAGDAESTYTWAFDASTGTLTIGGTGVVNVELGEQLNEDSSSRNPQPVSALPWGSHIKDIKHVVVKEGITGLGDASLAALINMESVSLPSTLKTIGKYVFTYDISLKELIIPEGVTSIGEQSLDYLISLETLVLPDSLQTYSYTRGINSYFLKNLTISAAVESFDVNDAIYAENINNKSMTAVLDYSDVNQECYSEEYRYFFWLQADVETRSYFEYSVFGGTDESYSEMDSEMLTRFNARFGTSYPDIDSVYYTVDDFSELLKPMSVDRTIYCYENSAQHYVSSKNYDRHILYGTDTEHTSCLVFSGTSTDDNDYTFTWTVDPAARTLTINGTGAMKIDNDSNIPGWYYCSEYYDTVNIGEGITSIEGEYVFLSFETLNLPTTFTGDPNECLWYNTEVKNVNVAQGNSAYLSVDGAVYLQYTEENLAMIKNMYNIDTTGDLVLVYYPSGRSYFSISDRAFAVYLSGYFNYLDEITIPDTVVMLLITVSGRLLKKVNIPSSVKSIDGYWCYALSLEEINVAPDNTAYTSVDGILYSKDLSTLYAYPVAKKLTELELSEKTTKICYRAMYDYIGISSLKDVTVLNKDCVFESDAIPEAVVIHGIYDSTAQTYASSNGNKFIAIEEKEVAGIAVKTMPNKTEYTNKTEYMNSQQLKTDGLVITVTFTDGTTADRSTGFDITGFDTSKLGTCTLTVSYSGAECTFDVTIIEYTAPVLTEGTKLSVLIEADDEEYLKFIPTETATYKFTFSTSSSSYGYVILDANYNYYGDVFSSVSLEAGETYYLNLFNDYDSNETFTASVTKFEACEHSYSSYTRSSCSEKCCTYYTCSKCKHSYTEYTDPAPHTQGDLVSVTAPTCTQQGYTIYLCTECGQGYKTDVTEALDHDFSTEWTVDTEATCTTDGSKSHHCTRCSEKKDVTAISSTEHTMTDWVQTKAPTCTENGIRTRTCTGCAKTETSVIVATGHTDANKDGKCDSCGTDLGTKDPSENCSHMCHKTKGIQKFFWKIFNFFNKIFKIKQYCECGAKHW